MNDLCICVNDSILVRFEVGRGWTLCGWSEGEFRGECGVWGWGGSYFGLWSGDRSSVGFFCWGGVGERVGIGGWGVG